MPLTPGTCLGPYEILSPLGAGGMGEVYRARDTRLGRDVAVKVLPDHLAGDHKVLARFESEARAVAALSHPNILALYDVGQAGSVHFAVAELLEGETLRSLVSRGPLPLRRAIAVARQVADALAAAHEKGIVHRDLKPENVFLSRDDHAKVLDFGLARHDPALHSIGDSLSPTASVLTHDGEILGTVPYMSPEQARGLRVDFRSDQFSLGSLLYEMLSGKRPFRGATAADVLAAIIRDEPEPLSRLLDGLPPQLLSVLDRCLAKEPSCRYDSSRDLARDLDACALRLASSAAGTTAPASAPAQSATGAPGTRRRPAAAAVVAALALLAPLGLWVSRKPAQTGPAMTGPATAAATAPASPHLDPRRIAVARFENRTGDPSLDLVERIATEWVTEGISNVGIDVVPSGTVYDVPAPARTGAGSAPRESTRELAERTGAGIVVSGGFHLRSGSVEFQAQAVDAATGKLVQSLQPASSPRADPMPAIDSMRRQVRDVVFARVEERGENQLAVESRPPKYEAYREFLLGSETFGVDYESSERHFRRALEIDPDYVSPRVYIASGYWDQGRREEAAREIAHLDARRENLSPFWLAGLRAWEALFAGRPEDMLVAARELERLSPGDPSTLFDVSSVALRANHPRESVKVLSAASHWDLWVSPNRPQSAYYFVVLGRAHHGLGEHEEELAAVRRGLETFKNRPLLLLRAEVAALVALGRRDEVEKSVAEAARRPGEPTLAAALMLDASDELRGHGFPADARAMAERSVVSLRALPNGRLNAEGRRTLALALLGAERWQEAVPLLATLEKEDPPGAIRWKGLRAFAAYRAGDMATGSRLENELRRLDRPYLLGEDTFYLAALAAARGDKDRAVELLGEAISEGYSEDVVSPASYSFHRAVQLAPLLGYPPFEVLTRPKD